MFQSPFTLDGEDEDVFLQCTVLADGSFEIAKAVGDDGAVELANGSGRLELAPVDSTGTIPALNVAEVKSRCQEPVDASQ
eukprot:27462-Eustigmatos_ZCMA.PRE.1